MRLRTCSPSIPFSRCSRPMCSRARSNDASSPSDSRHSPQAYSSVQADNSMTPLVIAYPVDDFDPCPAVTNYQYRFCAIPSLVDLVGAPYRVVLVSGPSCIMPLACCGVVRRVSFLVDGVNAHVTPVIAANQFLWDRCR